MSGFREKGPIVLVGSPEDDHVQALRGALAARGEEPVVFDSLRFPAAPAVSMRESAGALVVDGRPLGTPRAVYLRSLYLSPLAYLVDVEKEMEANWRTTMVVFREKSEFLLSVLRRWEDRGVPVYNPLRASDKTRKPFQLARLAEAGLPVPETLWTNDPAAVRAFARGRRIAYKPVSGGASTKELEERDLTDERLGRLAHCPVTFQELLPGEDLRVFVLDGRVIAALRIEVEEGALDYRQREKEIRDAPAPPGVEEAAIRAAEAIGLRFSGIDFKADAAGAYKILECNPSPMFLGFDARGGSSILESLAEALASARRE